jgi:hypothetical protein
MFPGETGNDLAGLIVRRSSHFLASTMWKAVEPFTRDLVAHGMLLLQLWSELRNAWDDDMYTSVVPRNAQDLDSLLNAIGRYARSSFAARLKDIGTPPSSPPLSTTIDDMTYAALTYLEQLPLLGDDVVATVLHTMDRERGWLEATEAPPSGAVDAEEEGGILNLYAADVLGTLINSLKVRAERMPTLVGAMYLLENGEPTFISRIANPQSRMFGAPHLRGKCCLSGRAQKTCYTSRSTRPRSESRPRPTADPRWYLSEWRRLVQLTSYPIETPLGNCSVEQSTNKAAAAFFGLLARLEDVCRQHRFLSQNPKLRERIGTEVSDLVCQGYTLFWDKAHSRGYGKYLCQTTPDALHRRVQNVFR